MPVGPLADTAPERLSAACAPAADPERAVAVRARTKDVASFPGPATPVRRAPSRAVGAGPPRPDEADCTAVAPRCRELPGREHRYFAVDHPRRRVRHCSSGFPPAARHLVTTVFRWDTVGLLAAHVVGAPVAAGRSLTAGTDGWSGDGDLRLARTALLHQPRSRERTDTARLFDHCPRRSGHPDFSVRKAVGRCPREDARTDPDAVRDLLARGQGRFAPLAVREAPENTGDRRPGPARKTIRRGAGRRR
ncbi:DNA alkylation repair protein [Streptomyces caelestis]|uniref:DNA alkylation repair protein n=1 Tax=Streptomyces caelestis TaxID=36816 RepID=UPI003655814B